MRLTLAVLIVFSFMLAGCGKSSEQTELEKQNAQLKQELASKDKFVDEVTSTINEIHNKLESTWALEQNVLRQNPSVEESKTPSQAELKEKIMDRISSISSILSENRKKVSRLQRLLAEQKTKYSGLSEMVDNLRKTLDDREQTIAQMQTKVMNLENEVTAKSEVIAARDVVISHQTKQINTVYYVAGKKGELIDKKIVAREGGIFWGLLGTTTVLTSTYNDEVFTTLDKTQDMFIEIAGTVDELVPARDPASYTLTEKPNHHTLVTITNTENFWRAKHLAIVID